MSRPKRNPDDPSAGLHLLDSGAISNSKVERYALMLADEILTPYKCWVITNSYKGGTLPSSKRQQNIHSSAIFKARVEELKMEKAALQEQGIWGELEWQARQNWRRAAALEDIQKQIAATNQLLQIALKGGKPAKVDAPEEEAANEPGEKRSRGAPVIESPVPAEIVPDFRLNKLLDR